MALWSRVFGSSLLFGLCGCSPAPIAEPGVDSAPVLGLSYAQAPDWPRLAPGRTLGRVLGVALDASGQLWISQDGEGKPPPPLWVLTADTGEIVREVPLHGIVTPHALAFDAQGLLWVTDSDGDRLVALDADGNVVRELGQR